MSTAIMDAQLYASFFLKSLGETTPYSCSCKNQRNSWIKNIRCLKDNVSGSYQTFYQVRLSNIGALRLRSTDWKSSQPTPWAYKVDMYLGSLSLGFGFSKKD